MSISNLVVVSKKSIFEDFDANGLQGVWLYHKQKVKHNEEYFLSISCTNIYCVAHFNTCHAEPGFILFIKH